MVRRALGNHHVRPDTLLVTSETTKQTVPVAEETESRRETTEQGDARESGTLQGDAREAGTLRELIEGARHVLFDFDGPICRLFAGRPAAGIARDQVDWLDAQGLGDVLTEEERADADPHAALRRLGRARPDSDLVLEMENRLTEQELRAVRSAWPTEHADPLIRTWSASGARLAITTNNSAEAARRYIAGRGLSDCFEPHIYGRTENLARLKPDPYCLNRAMQAMGASPGTTLMIGDAATDLDAAREAGVAFLGYARHARKEAALRQAGARQVTGTLEPIIHILRHRSGGVGSQLP
ncbi:HAD family hydrolase [Streptomyces sp. SDT5-1]|uniref:HAD family hydrolase n=1 Tax=Streptomyces sp. SDT5-1 TaxID=3406418 RepID=UPI003FD3949E